MILIEASYDALEVIKNWPVHDDQTLASELVEATAERLEASVLYSYQEWYGTVELVGRRLHVTIHV